MDGINHRLTPSPNDNAEIFKTFGSWREDGTFTDFTLIASDGSEFQVHKNVVATRSLYLRTLLMNWNEGETCNISGKTKLPDISPEVCLLIIIYCYPIYTTQDSGSFMMKYLLNDMICISVVIHP